MDITVRTPAVDALGPVVAVLASWQREGLPVQLHPGDLGWHWRFGATAVAGCLRVWSRDQEVVAVGFADGDGDGGAVLRMGLAPSLDHDDDVARRWCVTWRSPRRTCCRRRCTVTWARRSRGAPCGSRRSGRSTSRIAWRSTVRRSPGRPSPWTAGRRWPPRARPSHHAGGGRRQREMGSSSAVVATPAANVAGVATYLAAGFAAAPGFTDFRRPGCPVTVAARA